MIKQYWQLYPKFQDLYLLIKLFLKFAYQDKAFPIGSGQTISNPYTVAYQTSLLKIKARDKILEVGTGSGYQTAILLELKAQIYTIEKQKGFVL